MKRPCWFFEIPATRVSRQVTFVLWPLGLDIGRKNPVAGIYILAGGWESIGVTVSLFPHFGRRVVYWRCDS